jgi:uncharacterized protein
VDKSNKRHREERLPGQPARTRLQRGDRLVVLGLLLAVLMITVITFGVLMLRPHNGPKAPGKASAEGRTEGRQGVHAGTDRESSNNLWVSVETNYPSVVEKRSNTRPPAVAIVIDDVGNTLDPLPLWTAIDAPLSFSVMPYPPLSKELALRIRQSGYRVMMHIPTQNAPPNSFAGKGQLNVGMSRGAVFSELDKDLAAVILAGGINNHQGGLGCDDPAIMTYEVEWAKQRGLFVVDSKSSANSQVSPACLAMGLPQRRNEVFIDHQNEPDYIRAAMRRLADIARANGTAIGICHWHRPNTPAVVGEMIIQLEKEGINFAYVGDVTN